MIMYNTLLNHPLLKEYWRTLAKEGLLTYDRTTQLFKTTAKGYRLLDVFSELGPRSSEKKNKIKRAVAAAA